ncbi:glycosyltransferase [Photobacterium leiognathi]|uniref:glycosyltransferase n=1 Tax=Photobacterium leiognathi TaxID=553611 RepID=UPI0034E9621C
MKLDYVSYQVIATNVGATPELIINAETGFLVEPKDINTVEIAISTMINDNILRKENG